MADDFQPRNYQVELMKIALSRNTIIYLPTGAGKTFIAVMVLKHMSAPLMGALDERKMSVILVNTVALVHQHSEYLKRHTDFKIGAYTGDLNLDFWDKSVWQEECSKHEVFVMTCQILTDAVSKSFISLDTINLIVFDECHRGVNDHSMRQLMKHFQNSIEQPRVLGLTATLLNGNCKQGQVREQVSMLETTYHSKVATVDELRHVIGFSTNPREVITIYKMYSVSRKEEFALNTLSELLDTLSVIKIEERPAPRLPDLIYLDPDKGLSELSNIVKDIIFHLTIFGTFGGIKALIAHVIQIERFKRHCIDSKMCNVLNSVITSLTYVKKVLEDQLSGDVSSDIIKYSTPKVIKLFEILKEYKKHSTEELCCIVFVQRRFTAKILYHILHTLAEVNSEFSFIKPNFVVGFNNNPANDTREYLYFNKINKQIIQSFFFKETNLLVASNVLEEGIDVPKCSLVIKFDAPLDYRSYIQSKGRARHKSSYYYVMAKEGEEYLKFMERYQTFQAIEHQLNQFLIGQNEYRDGPSAESIQQQLYEEDEIPPYYVDGPNSAQVNLLSSISLLISYCNSLISDMYTIYAPNWYLEKHSLRKLYKVIIEMPVVCPIIEPVEGPFMSSKKQAKRAAALEACKVLHRIGELDDNLIPLKRTILHEDSNHLFSHWPQVTKHVGNSKTRRNYNIIIPNICIGSISSNTRVHVHVINITAKFIFNEHLSIMNDMYSSDLCYAFISLNKLPRLCEFPLFVSAGELTVNIKTNINELILTEKQLIEIKNFNYLVYNDVLGLLRNFLIFNNVDNMFLLTPYLKSTNKIAFNVIMESMHLINDVVEPNLEEKKNLCVTIDNYGGKIVIPWYRKDRTEYVVIEVCEYMNALTTFPGSGDDTYFHYFKSTYAYTTINVNQPLLRVKALSSRLNCFKPRGASKRNKDLENADIHLIPEMVVKQNFPASLWIQAKLLPSIFDRVMQLLRAEQLRFGIACDTSMQNSTKIWQPLTLDKHLLNYKNDYNSQKEIGTNDESLEPCDLKQLASILSMLNTDVAAKKLNADFPWDKDEEPINIERNLNATVMDIQYFENFISKKLTLNERKSGLVYRSNVPAIEYEKNFIPKCIELLERDNFRSPQLAEIYQALATAKCNEIVNLERFETLGDSFLKLIASVFIILRYPKYDEGKSTTLKGKLVSNKNLYYLGTEKKLGEYLKYRDLKPKDEWCPPGFVLPNVVYQLAISAKINNGTLLNLDISKEEQINGSLTKDREAIIRNEFCNEETEILDDTLSYYMGCQEISDKTIADVVEAIIGAYLLSGGIAGGIKVIEWFGIIPASEKLTVLLKSNPPNPVLNVAAQSESVDYLMPGYRIVEKELGYTFKNRAYLLQALTHSSYTPNRITGCYQRLEFLGDAVLDFLITCNIYESCGYLNPGDLTDLRSALVNNVTFACFAVRCGFHKHLLAMNSKLQGFIDRFIIFQESKDFAINDDVLILLNENDLHIAEYIDVPKVLGDLFEALAGAVYLDSGMDLKTVWNVFYRIMWKEIEMFSNKVPKNAIRVLHETDGTYPEFHKPLELEDGRVMMKLDFMMKGTKKRVHGFGDNKKVAKKAAAKIALRLLGV